MKYDVYEYSRITEYNGTNVDHYEEHKRIATCYSLDEAMKFITDYENKLDTGGLERRTEYKVTSEIGVYDKRRYEYGVMYSYIPLPYGVYGIFVKEVQNDKR